MAVCVDSAIFPELIERQVQTEHEQAVTNRLYALTDFLKTRPCFPQQETGHTDDVCFGAWRTAWLTAHAAVTDVARATTGWAAGERPRQHDEE